MRQVVTTLLLLLLVPASFNVVFAEITRPVFIVSLPPQKFLLEKIAGDKVVAKTLTAASRNPETFEPTPKQIEQLLSADFYLTSGIKVEKRWLKIIEANESRLAIIRCCEQWMTLHDEHHADPHVWTDPVIAVEIAAVILDTLVKHDVNNHEYYQRNFANLKTQLESTDRRIGEILKKRNRSRFYVSHPAWGYFAKRYQLEQVALEHEGRELGPRALTEVIRQARDDKINKLFVQQQHRSKLAERFADDLDIPIITVNPIHDDYLENLLWFSEELASSLQ